jgi:hypothetical protein
VGNYGSLWAELEEKHPVLSSFQPRKKGPSEGEPGNIFFLLFPVCPHVLPIKYIPELKSTASLVLNQRHHDLVTFRTAEKIFKYDF